MAAHAYTGAARDLVLALKFRKRLDAAAPLGEALAEELIRAGTPGDLIVPVPLSRRRRRERGYNQTLVLARAVRKTLRLDLAPRALCRRAHGRPQAGRAPSDRLRGPRGAFAARGTKVRGRSVILIDDVITSGATARACALALRRAGAQSTVVAVACRADGR